MIKYWLFLYLFLYNGAFGQSKPTLHKNFEENTIALLSPYHLYQFTETTPLAAFQDIRSFFIKDTHYKAINAAGYRLLNHAIDQVLIFQDKDSLIAAFQLILPYNPSLLKSMKECFGDDYWEVRGYMGNDGLIDKSTVANTYSWKNDNCFVYVKTVETGAGSKMAVEIISRKKTSTAQAEKAH